MERGDSKSYLSCGVLTLNSDMVNLSCDYSDWTCKLWCKVPKVSLLLLKYDNCVLFPPLHVRASLCLLKLDMYEYQFTVVKQVKEHCTVMSLLMYP